MSDRMMLRLRVEDFLFHEAELLDAWKLNEWLALFADDAIYQVPSTDLTDADSADDNLFYVADDRARLEERVIRLNKRGAHAEQPRSKTRHVVTNIRCERREDGEIAARAAFVTFRAKGGHTDHFVGHSRYRLREAGDSFLIAEKRCALDMDGLRPQGRISILL